MRRHFARLLAGSRIRSGMRLALTRQASLDLRFLELDVLARLRIVLPEAQLLGLGTGVLLGHVEEARVRGADELDLDGCRLGHRTVPNARKKKSGQPPPVPACLWSAQANLSRFTWGPLAVRSSQRRFDRCC